MWSPSMGHTAQAASVPTSMQMAQVDQVVPKDAGSLVCRQCRRMIGPVKLPCRRCGRLLAGCGFTEEVQHRVHADIHLSGASVIMLPTCLQVISVQLNTVPYAYRQAAPISDSITIIVGAPWQGGARTELTFPYQTG
eukprot:GHUV01057347.1.p1 GENE.GHUV01057347.1~~GHUV01057347.1.p1  ORF type:complete len:137 (-),score=15.98 GHUV01057347.1:13-423(-)